MTILSRASDVFRVHADRVFLVDTASDVSLTFDAVLRAATCLAAELDDRGVERGDRVALLQRNTVELPLLEIACLFIGATMVPIVPELPPRDIEYILGVTSPRLVVRAPSTSQLVSLADHETWELVPHAEGGPPVTDLCVGVASEPFPRVEEDDVVSIHFTSGTTSRPKAVPHRLRSLLRNAVAFNDAVGIGPHNRFLHIFPMAYMAGFLNTLICPLMGGASVVLAPPFDARSMLRFWQPIIRNEVDTLWLSPTMLAVLLRIDRDPLGKEYGGAHLSNVCVGTAPLPESVRDEFEDDYGAEVLNSYGLSELLIVATETPGRSRRKSSVGRPLPGVEVQVADPDDTGVGELLVRSPDASLELMSEHGGWFATGDLGGLDDEGNVSVSGRKKDLIIRGGVNISPRAVEDVLLAHASIDDAAVVGLPHDLYGEEVVVAVRLKPDRELDAEVPSLRQWCDARLAPAARPARYFDLQVFPTGATGKVQRDRLREALLDLTRSAKTQR